jgi:arylsulfatase A-like enzyme
VANGCGQAERSDTPVIGREATTPPQSRPNVLVVLWDTARADRLSLYGHERPTTPHLDAFAEGGRVYEDAIASASSTVPTHASLFTGLLPSEHGANSSHQWLEDRFDTLAEKLQRGGYGTFLWASNPHVSSRKNFAQGFEYEAHPWDPEYRDEARRILKAKLAGGTLETAALRRLERYGRGPLAAAGELALAAFESFLDRDAGADRPWFAFLNYMEAHRPYLPNREHRRAVMSEAEVERSYALRSRWFDVWAHVLGARAMDERDLEILGATYDAALHELDTRFAEVIDTLAARGELENTIVVLTADHGELLGEHGLVDHA